MVRKRYTAEEIIGHLHTLKIELGKGVAVREVCRKLGIMEQSSRTSCLTGNSSIRCGQRGLSLDARGGRIIRFGPTVPWAIGLRRLTPSLRNWCVHD
jgi:hypothetical protein